MNYQIRNYLDSHGFQNILPNLTSNIMHWAVSLPNSFLFSSATSFPVPHYGPSFSLIPKWNPESNLTFSDKFLIFSIASVSIHPELSFILYWRERLKFHQAFHSLNLSNVCCTRAFHSINPSNLCFFIANQIISNLYMFWPTKTQIFKAGVESLDGEVQAARGTRLFYQL